MTVSSSDQRNSVFKAISDVDSSLCSHTDHIIYEHNIRIKELKKKNISQEKEIGKGTGHSFSGTSILRTKFIFKSAVLAVLIGLIFFVLIQFNLGGHIEKDKVFFNILKSVEMAFEGSILSPKD